MDDGVIIVLSVFGGIVLLIIDAIISSAFQVVAEEKGYSSKKYFWFSFLFGIAGMLLIVAMPDLKLRQSINEKTAPKKAVMNDELPDL